MRVWVCYNAYLPTLSFWYGEHSHSILARMVLLTPYYAVLCKNWILCGVYWEDYKCKRFHVPTLSEAETTIDGLFKAAQWV